MASVFFPIPTIHRSFKSSTPIPINRFSLSQPRSLLPLDSCPFRSRFHFSSTSSRFIPLASTSSDVPPDDSLNSLEEARLAVSEYLQRLGVSEEESVSIASNSPRFLKMLVDGVRELDETSMWISWSSEGERPVGDGFGFKEKVALMAREKGDNGKVAFLESAGMNLSSAMNVARYLSGEMLPSLIYKVKYMKELFFSGSGDGKFIGKSARRMMTNFSIPPDDDVQQTLSFFEKIEARRGGLDMLSSNEESFRLLLESFPRMLLLSIQSHVKPMVEFLEAIGIPKERMRGIFLSFPPIIFFGTEVLKSRIMTFEKVGIVEMEFGKLLPKYPWITSNCIQCNLKQIVSFFELEKVPNASITDAIRSWPLILGSSASKLELMVDSFDELGVRSKKLGQVIATSPQLLLQRPQEFLQVVSYLEEIGFDKESVGRILARCPEIFATSVEKTLRRKLEFLISIGVSKTHLPRAIRKYPELLVSDPDRTLFPRIRYLRQRGLSKRDIAFMVGRFSPLLGYSIEEVLKPKLDFLVNVMEKPIKEVVEYPRYFSYSLEKKITPRFRVLKERNIECNLKDMLGKNDEEFAVMFMGDKGT
ncbi:transcription termination factor MTERF2, chloroplastic [Cucurbita moschata]|uniref:Transcription termination factor MTERF2, chloroplastic n=1 Tax=Cucurbita moschata TaxID=3662 RepID=A0A6J1GD59_CUCMO|nr:transcription termination factor MTERF2, chloroplastic [Cucurbita moschata]